MHRKLPRFIDFAAIAIALTAGGCMHHHHGAHHGGHHHGDGAHELGDGLTVFGSGEAKASPDIARTSIGIEVHAETAEAATQQANQQMTAILAALKAAGVADADLRTHDFSVSFERDPTPPQPVIVAPAAKGPKAAQVATPASSSVPRGSYRVSNTVEVTVRDVSKVSAVLTAATNAGANNVWGVDFDVQNPDSLHEKAREQAIARAKHSADELAKLTGVKLGPIVTIEDQADTGQLAPRMFKAAMAESADGAQVPVQGGELTITHQVRLVYALTP